MTVRVLNVNRLHWTNELIAKFWAYYAKYRPEDYFTNIVGDQLIKATARYIPAGAKILDFGCGSGFLLEKLLRNHQACGYDWSAENLETAFRRIGAHPNLLGLYAGEKGERPAGQFDVVYLVETLEHILDTQLEATLAEARAFVADGGVIIVTTPNDEDLEVDTVFCPCCEHTFHRWQHLRSLSRRSISELMGKHGFVEHAVFTTNFARKTAWETFKARIRPWLARKDPHLIYIGHKA